MSGTLTAVALPAWQGWIRKEGDRSTVGPPEANRLESGAALFTLPDSEEARTTSWARVDGLFCVFTGYLFNFAGLLKELAAPEPAASTPAELVLAGYRRWGRDALTRLEGMFALAIWDGRRQELLCACDAMGLHPFYYSWIDGELVFSWDMDAVRRHPSVPRGPNRPALAELLCGRVMDQEETFFAAVRRLPGGHALRLAHGKLEVFRWWELMPPGRPIAWVAEEEAARFSELLRQAVECCMQYGPVGILLSGGFDSISIAGWASRAAAEREWKTPRAYSVILSEAEERIQRSVAERLGFPQVLHHMGDHVEAHGFLGRMIDLAGVFPSPPLSFLAPPFMDLERLAKSQGCQAVLTGDGGDEWLTVSPAYAADLIRSADWRGLARLAQTEWRRWPSRSTRSLLKSLLWSFGFRELLRDWGWRRAPRLSLARRRRLARRGVPPWVAPDPALRRVLLDRFESWETQTAGDAFYLKTAREILTSPLKSICFEERFYRDLTVGIPSFHPYWHRPLVEFLFRTPPALLNAGERSKAVVRRSLGEHFPDLGLDKQKKFLAGDLSGEILYREAPALWGRLGAARSLVDLDIVHREGFHAMLDAWLRPGAKGHRVWYAASVEAWLRARE